MRQTCIFSGSSHPLLVESICERLGQKPSCAELKKFSNGETSVEIKTSVRDKDVFIVQSGSAQINDMVMEMLIMISACKCGSARSITAVMPYFPYSRQSKKKTHRGAITARMLANLMKVAGVDHVITIDLHASQMQGFFKCPVDNLFAESILAKWIRLNISDWRESVVVSKNPGGTKRVTSLADKLGLSFGIVTTDQRRPRIPPSMYSSALLETLGGAGGANRANPRGQPENDLAEIARTPPERQEGAPKEHDWASIRSASEVPKHPSRPGVLYRSATSSLAPYARPRFSNGHGEQHVMSPLSKTSQPEPTQSGNQTNGGSPEELAISRAHTISFITNTRSSNDEDGYEEPEGDDNTDELARDVITGRFVHGHIVNDDAPSSSASQYSAPRGQRHSSEGEDESVPDHMMQSFMSTASSRLQCNPRHGLRSADNNATHSDEEEEALQNPDIETHVTLVGNVREKTVIIVDDMIDQAGSWIAAAETVVKRGGATKVYCMATHGLFGGNALQQLEECEEIEAIVVTNSFPIPDEKWQSAKKLVILDVAMLLAEAIRRNHHGESISHLYTLMD